MGELRGVAAALQVGEDPRVGHRERLPQAVVACQLGDGGGGRLLLGHHLVQGTAGRTQPGDGVHPVRVGALLRPQPDGAGGDDGAQVGEP